MLKPDDRPVVYALWAVVFALIVTVSASPLATCDSYQEQPHNKARYAPPECIRPLETETFWIFMGFVVTCVIAAYGIRQFEEGRKSSQRQLRAYVLIDSADLTRGAHNMMAVLIIRNFGQTPAYDTKITYFCGWRDQADCLKELALEGGQKYVHPTSIIAPGHPVTIPIGIEGLTVDTNYWPNMAKMNKARPFIWGRIDYEDAFGNQCWTTFQLFSDLDTRPLAMSTCACGNDADH